MKRDYTVKELAKEAGVSPTYVRRLLAEGRIRGYKPGRDWLIPKRAAERWLEERGER